jgi:hypothetical protein
MRPLLIAAAVLCAAPVLAPAARAQEAIGTGGEPPPPEAAASAGPERERPISAQIFFSPAGEPFRSRPSEAYPVELWFAGADADRDGALTLAEFKADSNRFFKVLDVNGDGRVDGFENGDYETKVAPEIQPRIGGLAAQDVMTRKERLGGGPDPSMRARGGRFVVPTPRLRRNEPFRKGAGGFGLLDEAQPVRAADTNLDFRVSQEEWDKATARRFGQLDLNKDGRLDRAELPLTPVQVLQAKVEKQERGLFGRR